MSFVLGQRVASRPGRFAFLQCGSLLRFSGSNTKIGLLVAVAICGAQRVSCLELEANQHHRGSNSGGPPAWAHVGRKMCGGASLLTPFWVASGLRLGCGFCQTLPPSCEGNRLICFVSRDRDRSHNRRSLVHREPTLSSVLNSSGQNRANRVLERSRITEWLTHAKDNQTRLRSHGHVKLETEQLCVRKILNDIEMSQQLSAGSSLRVADNPGNS